jgi:hypothetical protein
MNDRIRDHAEPLFRPSATPAMVTRYDRVYAGVRGLFSALCIALVVYFAIVAIGLAAEHTAQADAAVRQSGGPVCAFGSGNAYSCEPRRR